ncbi:Hint domain-containing protein [Candidatus Daviesbacteria bacterium]|nr:Hint domain-containing protein [Candidatus Daviesbacteria bacterium]
MSPKGFIPLVILIIGVLVISGTLIAGSFYIKNIGKDQNIINPINSSIPSPTSLVENSNCTTDEECLSGYKCQVIESTSVVCPGGQVTSGTSFTPSVASCSPSTKVIKGICKLSEGGFCQTTSDCYSGLICHEDKCTSKINEGSCSGLDDTSCPTGYKCVQGCGPPVVRQGDNEAPGYFCQIKELADQPRNCPICLVSNTKISTPKGEINVTDLRVGMKVYSQNSQGKKIIVDIVRVSSTKVPNNHQVIHLSLADNRQLWVSPNHPAVNGEQVWQLQPGQSYDGSTITNVVLIPYWDDKTYDLLPNSDTGYYFANGILMGSTLK